MVKQRVAEAQTSAGEEAIGRALGELERVSLHRIRSKAAIEAICREVISRVDGAAELVRITPGRLEELRQAVQRKVKSNVAIPPLSELSEVEVNAQSAKIRNDWSSHSWKINPPRGWAWREASDHSGNDENSEKEIIALVYGTRGDPLEHEVFIDKEIYAHPRGALALIKNMNKRHAELMAWYKKQQRNKKKRAK